MTTNPPDLDAKLDALAVQLSRQHREMIASSVAPKSLRIVAQATADANGNATLVFPTVPGGRVHYLRRLVIGGATWPTTVTGSAIVAVNANQSVRDAAPSILDVVDAHTSLPNSTFYLDNQITIASCSALQIFISGGTANTTYCASALVSDYPAS